MKTSTVRLSKIGIAALTVLILSSSGAAFSAPPAGSASQLVPLSRTPERIAAIGSTGIPVRLVVAGRTYSGTYLSHVSELSLAYRSGLRATDVLISVNARGTLDPKTTQRIVNELEGGKNTTLSFARRVGASYRFGQIVSSWGRSAVKSQTPDKINAAPRATPSLSQVESNFFSLVNAERAKNRLGSLSPNSALAAVALKHGQDMRERHYFSHHNPEGKDWSGRALDAGIKGGTGENLETIFLLPTAEEIAKTGHKQFMNSSIHRNNILNPNWKTMDFGLLYKDDGTMIVVQMFGD